MRLAHVSDTHGLDLATHFPLPDGVDVVVHSGDLMPNRTRGHREVEETYQEHWCVENADAIAAWLGGRQLLYVPGNHDYWDPVVTWAPLGIDIVQPGGTEATCWRRDGLCFAGFQWVKFFTGEWNYEASEEAIAYGLESLPADVDVLITHGPPFGVRDRNEDGVRCGSMSLRKHLRTRERPVKLLLFGHIHPARGVLSWSRGMQVSNASQAVHVLEVNP